MKNLLLAGVMSRAVLAAPNDAGAVPADTLAAKRARLLELTALSYQPTDAERDEIGRLQYDLSTASETLSAAADVRDKDVVLMISRDHDPRHIPDVVAGWLVHMRAAPRGGFMVRSVPDDAETGMPAHLRVSFDPEHGMIDRDLVAAALEAPLAAALAI